nr:TetR/AcrR family transcriptional regulator [Kibdelosporangium sp. MJ126-NF4]CEL17890.1 Transcriptional regulator, TetR family [Kibdelosporangium sp. MJ126-NF4]CTQ90886.1 Transcriptional regulator, TetR family [Kibdelosporangium sp. MJ126-NF4]
MADTKQRILDAARELFAQQGVQRTSLREIAEQLGISKPALYYHFASRDDLLRSIMQPLLDDAQQFVEQQAKLADIDKRALLEGYFDFHYRHRRDIRLLVEELTTLSDLGLVEMVLGWRRQIATMLVGPHPSLAEATKATIALGGLQDCTIEFADVPQAELRKVSVDAAWGALGLEVIPPDENRSGHPVV